MKSIDKEPKKEYNIFMGSEKGSFFMKYSELKKMLTQNGCYKESEGSRHESWFSPITNKTFPVGRHNNEDVPKGTVNAILKQSGIKE